LGGLLEFADWLESERYAASVYDQHLRRRVFILPRLSRDGRHGTYSSAQLEEAFGQENSPPSRLYRFATTPNAYQRFLLARGRLRVVEADERFAALPRYHAQPRLELLASIVLDIVCFGFRRLVNYVASFSGSSRPYSFLTTA
jgi:hypothetical protein